MMLRPNSMAWFARHEMRLSWREAMAMMTAGKRTRATILLLVAVMAVALFHFIANALIQPWVRAGVVADKQTLLLLSGMGALFWSVMLSQAMESVTRAYYARADLDLILSSPASSRKLFAVRTGAIALTTMALPCLLASPMLDMLIVHDGWHWLGAYGVLAALGAFSAAISVLVTIGLFRTVGPKRTRFVSQIIAAIVGAGFIIGIQAVAILSYGSVSRFSLLQSEEVIAAAPAVTSLVWWPARAAMGDLAPLALLMAIGFGALALVIAFTSSSFGQYAISTAGISRQSNRHHAASYQFIQRSPRQTLRAKEWVLLRRDPWLLSQTLMQILYLVPPALLLWLNYGDTAGIFVVVVPVLVMASGQLAGGLAWLAISGEDAHDLVATAPVSPNIVLLAKIEAVGGAILLVITPLLILLGLASVPMALIAALGVALASASATAIQMWFRVQARRSMFRRRQVSSRIATLCEALVSILWAATAAAASAGTMLAIGPAVLAIAVLGLAWFISPRQMT